MAVTYFGYTTVGSSSSGSGSQTRRSKNYDANHSTTLFVCPGSGTQNVVELSAYVKSAGGVAKHINLAIYPTDLSAPICQGSGEITISSTTPDWHGFGPAKDAALNPSVPTLVGGTAYVLAVTYDGADVVFYYNTGSSGDYGFYTGIDYTAGFPTPIAAGTDNAGIISIRCGVEPAAAGTIIPVVMSAYRRFRL